MRIKIYKQTEKNKWDVLGALFVFIGIGFILTSLFFYVKYVKIKNHGELVSATIVEIYEDNVYVEFESNGSTIRSRSDFYTSNMRPGQIIDYYFDPSNPETVIGSDQTFLTMFAGIGVLHIMFGLYLYFRNNRDNKDISKLMNHGVKLRLKVSDLHITNKMPNDPRHPIVLECQYIDDKGTLHHFFSEEMFGVYEREWFFNQYVTVYVDPNSYKNYHMDLHTLSEQE